MLETYLWRDAFGCLDVFFAGKFLERTEVPGFEQKKTGSWLNVGLYIPIVLLFYHCEGSVFRHPKIYSKTGWSIRASFDDLTPTLPEVFPSTSPMFFLMLKLCLCFEFSDLLGWRFPICFIFNPETSECIFHFD